MTDNVVKLFEGDQRAAELAGAIMDVVDERGEGMPIPMILGVLDIIHDHYKQVAKDAL